MELVKVKELTPHPKNTYFFDDMEGQKWDEFLESVRTSGVIEPIVITADKVIISGHQRVRACLELGIEQVAADVRLNTSEDETIKQLLETNVRQRGNIGGSMVKLGRIAAELERIYEVHRGKHVGNQYTGETENGKTAIGGLSKTQKDIAEMLGVSVDTINRAKKIATMPLEWQELVDSGTVSVRTAGDVVSKLSPEQQEVLISMLPAAEKITEKQMREYAERLQEKENVIAGYQMKLREASNLETRLKTMTAEKDALEEERRRLEVLASKPPVKEYVNVYPQDYDELKRRETAMAEDLKRTASEIKKRDAEIRETKERLEAAQKALDDAKKTFEDRTNRKSKTESDFGQKLKDDCVFFGAEVANFLEHVGGYAYLADQLNELPEKTRENYRKAINAVYAWAQNTLNAMEGIANE